MKLKLRHPISWNTTLMDELGSVTWKTSWNATRVQNFSLVENPEQKISAFDFPLSQRVITLNRIMTEVYQYPIQMGRDSDFILWV